MTRKRESDEILRPAIPTVEVTFADGFDAEYLMAMVSRLASDGYNVDVEITGAFPGHRAVLRAYRY